MIPLFFFLTVRRQPTSTLFPYTTLFRSLANGEGVVVNLSSSLGYRGDPLGVHYTSSKHGIRGLTKALALALAPTVRVNAIRSEEHTSELQSRPHLVCRLLLEKKKQKAPN